jgi:DNA gyrase subunit A
MQSTFSANMIALVDGAPEMLTLKLALQHYIDFRREVVRRRTLFELRKAQERAHILEGLRIALSNLDAIIALIRNAMDVEEARNGLMERFDLDQVQAQAILDMQLRRLAALERERIEEEYQQLQERIRDLEELLANPWRVLAVVRSETEELKKKVRGARMTQIGGEAEEFDRAALEPHQQVVVTLSKAGYIKRIPAATYRSQHRGGKGVVSMTRKEDDPVNHILIVDTHDTLLFFTDRGRVLPLVSYELKADTSRTVRGVPVVNVIPVADESVSSVIAVADMHEQGRSLVMATRKGTIKRIDLEQISNVRKSGVIVMNLRDDDELVAARLAGDDDDVIMVSQMGMSIRFPVAEVRTRQRVAGGVRGMELGPGDRIVAMDVVVPNSKLLVVSRKGFGKLTDLNRYRRQGRGGSGITTLKITRKTGRVAAAEVIADSDELYIVSEKAQVIRTNLSEIRTTKERIAQGVTIFKPEPGDAVASIACIRDLKELEEAAASTAKNGKTNGRVPKNSM